MNLLAFFHLPTATMVALVVSVAIPAAAALLAKQHWPDWLVGLVSLLLATGNGFFSEWAQAGDSFDWKPAAGTALVSYAIAVLGHYGLVKGDAYSKLKALGSRTPSDDEDAGDFTGADPLGADHQPEHAG